MAKSTSAKSQKNRSVSAKNHKKGCLRNKDYFVNSAFSNYRSEIEIKQEDRKLSPCKHLCSTIHNPMFHSLGVISREPFSENNYKRDANNQS